MIKPYFETDFGKLYCGNVFDILPQLEQDSVQTCVTSPPYWGLRSYLAENHPDKTKELGTEDTPEEYVSKMVRLYRLIKPLLKKDSCCWLNLGDTYIGGGRGSGYSEKQDSNKGTVDMPASRIPPGYKPKDLAGIPHKTAFALQADGWWYRQDIIWHKPNPMPECLSPETQIFIKQNDKILRRTLEYLWSNKCNLGNLEILSPTGWKKVKNIWETHEEVYSIDASNIECILASKNHKFPICHDVRRKNTEDTEVKDIRIKNDWLLYKTIHDFIEATDNYIDLVQIAVAQNEKKLYVQGDSSIIKGKQPRSIPSWTEICKKYKYPIKKVANNYETPLKRLMLNDWIPCKIAIGEQYPYHDKKIGSASSNGTSKCLLKIDYHLGRLIGLYIAEGGTKSGNDRGSVKLTFHKDETEYVNFVQEEVLKFGVHANIRTTKNYTEVTFNSILISTILRYFVTGKCTNKALNIDVILNLTEDFRRGILNGAIEGDGSIREKNGFSYTSASEQLVNDVKTLASSLGIVCAKIKNNRFDNRTNKTYTSYILYTPYKKRKVRYDDTLAIYPRTITNCKIKKRMIDIEVEGGLFIIGDGLISHNSVTDRCVKSQEYIFLLSKSENYYFDYKAIREPAAFDGRKDTLMKGSSKYAAGDYLPNNNPNSLSLASTAHERWVLDENGERVRNKRSVWTVNTKPNPVAHFATFPEALILPCVLAGSKEGDIVLDPFMGSGTTALLCEKLGRKWIGIDLNKEYCDIAAKQLRNLNKSITYTGGAEAKPTQGSLFQ